MNGQALFVSHSRVKASSSTLMPSLLVQPKLKLVNQNPLSTAQIPRGGTLNIYIKTKSR